MLSELYDVITIADAAWLWGYSERNINYILGRHGIRARKSGGTWLIVYRDLERELGKPLHSLRDLELLSEK